MLLRRMTEHVRAQNWTAIVLDFVIVVVGVFIGIQVSNWNQTRADQRRGQEYSERLAGDLERDLAGRRGLTAYFGAVLESVERTDALLADPDSDLAELVINAYRASEINYSPPTRATWDEVVSSGDTGLLPRAALESGVAAYYAADTAMISLNFLAESEYRRRVRRIIPLEVQIALRAGCSDLRNDAQEIIGFMPDCDLDVSADTIAATAQALRDDPELRSDLRYQYSHVYTARTNISGDVVFLERALAALTEGEGHPDPGR
jgi:hypothetical protein